MKMRFLKFGLHFQILNRKRVVRKTFDKSYFLGRYKFVLKEGGLMNLKTDNDGFYHYTLEQIEILGLHKHAETADLYHSDLVDEVLSIKTYYEKNT